jgi:hypothetical protein
MTAIIDIKTDVLPKKYLTELYNIFEVYAVKKDMTDFIDLGKVYVFFEFMPKDIKLNTIYEPSRDGRDWFGYHKHRLSLIPDGLKATKHIHTYPKDHLFPIPANTTSLHNFLEEIKGSKELKSVLKEHMQFIKNKITMRLFHEYDVTIDGFKLK